MKNQGLRATITIAALLIAVIHHITKVQLDVPTIILLVVAAIPWMQPLFKTIELLGVKFELQDLQERVNEAHKTLQLIEENATLPGKKDDGAKLLGGPTQPQAAVRSSPATTMAMDSAIEGASPPTDEDQEGDDSWNSDPNRGKFGGSSVSNGRVLEAVITPAVNAQSAACDVVISVKSTDPKEKPLKGRVEFFLHPTFGRWKRYQVNVKQGAAQDRITSWGVFTVGAIADDGKTKLELNLREVPGGTRKFYLQ